MDADNGRDIRVSDFALIRKWSSHASSLVLTVDGAIPSGHAHRHASVTSLCVSAQLPTDAVGALRKVWVLHSEHRFPATSVEARMSLINQCLESGY